MDAQTGLESAEQVRLGSFLQRLSLGVGRERVARIAFFLLGDATILSLSIFGALWLRFDGAIPESIRSQIVPAIGVSLIVKLPIFAIGRLYAMSWSQVGLEEMVAVFGAGTLGTVVFWLAVLGLRGTGILDGFPRSVLLIDYIVTLFGVGTLRMGRRVSDYVTRRPSPDSCRALIVGAGAAGLQLARSLRASRDSGYAPIGFLDDDPRKVGTTINGMRVLGNRRQLAATIREHLIEAVLIAMPSAGSKVLRGIVSACRETGVREIRIVPGLEHLLNREVSFTDLRDVKLEDLLGREPVRIDTAAVGAWLRGRVVLVTGASGSIGSELCLQLAQFRPAVIAAMDWDETGVFRIEHELRRLGQSTVAVLGDIRDAERTRETFARIRPEIVFHAAAYKHVGLMERHPADAVLTNVLGTLSVAQASASAGAEKFILVSTDKAVNPTSVMGATKRAAEHICHALNSRAATCFAAVRFGNVLGSRGSVIPLFVDRLRRGEPITVRGSDMQRYFMAVSEAVTLVLQAGLMARGGETFVLDMGEPVKIIDLAQELVRLCGLEPGKDVPINFADPEPGEKDHEDLLTAEEGTIVTRHDRVRVARGGTPLSPEATLDRVIALGESARMRDIRTAVVLLQELVPTYRPSEFLLAGLNGQGRDAAPLVAGHVDRQ